MLIVKTLKEAVAALGDPTFNTNELVLGVRWWPEAKDYRFALVPLGREAELQNSMFEIVGEHMKAVLIRMGGCLPTLSVVEAERTFGRTRYEVFSATD